MDDEVRVNDDVVIPASELTITASRSGGPGGQHVNTTSSRVTLRWNVSETSALNEPQRARVLKRFANRLSTEGVLIIHSDTERSQHRNRQIALERLVALVSEALMVPKHRIPTKKSRAVTQRRLGDKKHRSQVKRDRNKPRDDD
ncbi:MAG: alternative ribosome rescue aminoacyl-tRNA hydrolase ArfB [Myxococcota bacterium]|nr:alternative ribosome rescue aminoacyl-tRNA hydrolase ArfB [Myxococcota bacterium]